MVYDFLTEEKANHQRGRFSARPGAAFKFGIRKDSVISCLARGLIEDAVVWLHLFREGYRSRQEWPNLHETQMD
jgi:hypothetical protein